MADVASRLGGQKSKVDTKFGPASIIDFPEAGVTIVDQPGSRTGPRTIDVKVRDENGKGKSRTHTRVGEPKFTQSDDETSKADSQETDHGDGTDE